MKVYELIVENDDWENSSTSELEDQIEVLKRKRLAIEHEQVQFSQNHRKYDLRSQWSSTVPWEQQPYQLPNLKQFIQPNTVDADKLHKILLRDDNKWGKLKNLEKEITDNLKKLETKLRTRQRNAQKKLHGVISPQVIQAGIDKYRTIPAFKIGGSKVVNPLYEQEPETSDYVGPPENYPLMKLDWFNTLKKIQEILKNNGKQPLTTLIGATDKWYRPWYIAFNDDKSVYWRRKGKSGGSYIVTDKLEDGTNVFLKEPDKFL